MDVVERALAIWQNVSIVQRALLIAIVLTLGLTGALVVHWARKPDMRVLYRELSPEEASKITEKIAEKDIAYELRNGGSTIYVPKEAVYQLRLDMAREGLPAGQQGGYALFDKEKIGISPFVQNVNLQRALQDELAKSIQMIDGVDHARVHIVNTEQKLFASEAARTTASVVLKLRAGYRLSSFNIASITHLVAGSVEGLKSENVTVVDSQGHLLSGESDQAAAHGAGTAQDFRERIESNLSKKVEDMLTAVLGPDRASVRVSAVVDMNSVSTVTEKYEPKGVVAKEDIRTSTEPVAGGQAADGSAVPTPKKEEEITTEYELGKTVKQETILPGKVMSLKVAALVDLSPESADPNAAAGGTEARIMQIADVEELIKNALGLEDASSIKVVDVKFNRQVETILEEEPSSWPRYLAIARHASLGIMAVCALLALKIFQGASKKTTARGEFQTELPEATAETGLLPPGGVGEPTAVRRQIAAALQSNPEQVKQLFASWIEEKGG